jgi:hypothetical protein
MMCSGLRVQVKTTVVVLSYDKTTFHSFLVLFEGSTSIKGCTLNRRNTKTQLSVYLDSRIKELPRRVKIR